MEVSRAGGVTPRSPVDPHGRGGGGTPWRTAHPAAVGGVLNGLVGTAGRGPDAPAQSSAYLTALSMAAIPAPEDGVLPRHGTEHVLAVLGEGAGGGSAVMVDCCRSVRAQLVAMRVSLVAAVPPGGSGRCGRQGPPPGQKREWWGVRRSSQSRSVATYAARDMRQCRYCCASGPQRWLVSKLQSQYIAPGRVCNSHAAPVVSSSALVLPFTHAPCCFSPVRYPHLLTRLPRLQQHTAAIFIVLVVGQQLPVRVCLRRPCPCSECTPAVQRSRNEAWSY